MNEKKILCKPEMGRCAYCRGEVLVPFVFESKGEAILFYISELGKKPKNTSNYCFVPAEKLELAHFNPEAFKEECARQTQLH